MLGHQPALTFKLGICMHYGNDTESASVTSVTERAGCRQTPLDARIDTDRMSYIERRRTASRDLSRLTD